MNGVQFIISVVSLLNQAESESGGLFNIHRYLGIGICSYAAMVVILVMCHSCSLSPNLRPKMEVEKAYEVTNGLPIIDGILEIGLARQFGCQCFIYFVWAIYFLFIAALVYAMSIGRTAPYMGATALCALTLYQVTSDVCEYWVHTRPQNVE